jgi:rRNA-processing protein FCF1
MIERKKVIKVIQDKIDFLETYDLLSFKKRILILKDVLKEIEKL